MTRELPVRCGNGPIHIATKVRDGYSTACGPTLASAKPVPVAVWERQQRRRCGECDEIAAHAPNRRILRIIAGW